MPTLWDRVLTTNFHLCSPSWKALLQKVLWWCRSWHWLCTGRVPSALPKHLPTPRGLFQCPSPLILRGKPYLLPLRKLRPLHMKFLNFLLFHSLIQQIFLACLLCPSVPSSMLSARDEINKIHCLPSWCFLSGDDISGGLIRSPTSLCCKKTRIMQALQLPIPADLSFCIIPGQISEMWGRSLQMTPAPSDLNHNQPFEDSKHRP